jgi:hypothetical protein
MRGDDSNPGRAFETGNPPRLTEESGVDPWLVGLVRSTGPYKSPPGRKQRVLLSLGRSNAPRRALLFLRPVIVAGVLISCGAFASAALGPWRGWIGRAYGRLVPSSERVASAPEQGRVHRSGAAHGLALATPPVDSPPAPVAIPPSLAPPSGAAVGSREPVAPPHVHRAALPSPSPSASLEERETQTVLAGMRALRLDHDPVRARTLLARYLERHPNGALAEEALALTIEAAVAHQDGDAPTLGARYLRQYPGGPFRELASRAKR